MANARGLPPLWRNRWRRSKFAALCCLAAAAAGTTTPTISVASHSTPSSDSGGVGATTATTAPRSALAECRETVDCAECLASVALETSRDKDDDEIHLDGEFQVQFFATLLHSPACNRHFDSGGDRSGAAHGNGARARGLLDAALGELLPDAEYTYDGCLATEVTCFASRDCRTCLWRLYTEPHRTTHVLSSAHCAAVGPTALQRFVTASCIRFPQCTWSKLRCFNSSGCSRCFDLLAGGDTTAAAGLCGSGHDRAFLDQVAWTCMYDVAQSCAYWTDRCNNHTDCRQCLGAIGGARSAAAVISGFSAGGCDALLASGWGLGYSSLTTYLEYCGEVPSCAWITAQCAMDNSTCVRCLNGSATAADAPTCAVLLGGSESSVDAICAACPAIVTTINRIVLATSVVGGVSVAACLAVVAVILAHRRDKASMRDRIVVGLFVANAVYSVANAVPLNSLHLERDACGQLALPFSTIRLGRAWWFGGKYALAGFEIFVLGGSIWALRHGARALPWAPEALFHLGCTGLGLGALLGFYFRCAEINASGYNAETQVEAHTDAYRRLGRQDDIDDDDPGAGALPRFTSGRAAYDGLVQRMLQGWTGLLGVAILLWIYLRRAHAQVVERARTDRRRAWSLESADEWASTRRSEWRERRRLLEQQQAAYAAVAKPLELYVLIFLAFGIPASVMASDWCQNNSGSRSTGLIEHSTDSITYGTCDVWCELVLSFRSLATVVVYLLPKDRRREFFDLRTTCRKLSARLLSCCLCLGGRGSSGSGKDQRDAVEMALFAMSADSDKRWQIARADVTLHRVLDQGASGVVWEATLHKSVPDPSPSSAQSQNTLTSIVPVGGPSSVNESVTVAVKVLTNTALDSDGHARDMYASLEFKNECAVLKRLRHPQLLAFLGFGTLEDGAGFIVTELAARGSLKAVLADPESITLAWETRVGVALDIALGMAHLHGMPTPIVHRDLKSANVLLNAELRAKVADFGTSKLFRPPQPDLVYSSFTGESWPAPHKATSTSGLRPSSKGSNDGLWDTGGRKVPLSSLCVSVLDDDGTMTRGVGTLLWLAPEVFRGDRSYSSAVDVYSFAIILHEIAHPGQTPWAEFGASMRYSELLGHLAAALKSGRRPAVDKAVAAERTGYVQIMARCWCGDPAGRPEFPEVVTALRALQGTEEESRGAHGAVMTSALRDSKALDSTQNPLTQPLLPSADTAL